MTKKPTPPAPSTAIVSPALKRRSLKERAIRSSSPCERPSKRGICSSSSVGASAMARFYVGKLKATRVWQLFERITSERSATSPLAVFRRPRRRSRHGHLVGVANESLMAPGSALLALALGRVQLAEAKAVELLAPLPQRDRFVEAGLAAFEPLDDLLELALRRLEGWLTRHGRRTLDRKSTRLNSSHPS